MPLSKIVANSITDNTITTDQIADNSVHGRRSLVDNGAMLIKQRATSSSDISGSGYYVHDRHRISMGNTAGRLRMSDSGVAPDGFASSLRLQCTTADTSIASNEDFSLQHRFEGQNLQQLKKGTSGAEQVTVSFYMKTNKAFTFVCELDDTDNNRFNGQQFTTTTDWTRHVLTFAGDTTGALDNDNARSLMLSFWLHAGSNFTSGTYTANTWQSRASTDVNRAVGIGSFFDSTDNEIRLTGLQMEIGNVATPFEHRSFGEELHDCKRYFLRTSPFTFYPVVRWASDAGRPITQYTMPVTMRAAPSVSISTSFTSGQSYSGTPLFGDMNVNNFYIMSSQTSASANNNYWLHNGVLDISAEL